jgi:hypothetical protein
MPRQQQWLSQQQENQVSYEIGTVGICRHTVNEVIVKATHENFVWVQDRRSNGMFTIRDGELQVAPADPRTFRIADMDVVELTPALAELLLKTGVKARAGKDIQDEVDDHVARHAARRTPESIQR